MMGGSRSQRRRLSKRKTLHFLPLLLLHFIIRTDLFLFILFSIGRYGGARGGWRCGGGEDSSGGGGIGMKGGDKEDAYRMRRQQQGKQGQGSEGWGTCESFFSILFHSLLILI